MSAHPGAADREAQLLVRMAGGDEAALVELYRSVAPSIHACALRILRDPEEARDATAEALWRLWSRASQFTPGAGSGAAWVLTVARRIALDRRRRLVRRGRILSRFRELSVQPAATERSLAQRRDVQSALGRLSADDRRLLEDAYYQGLSGSNIAARDDLPLGTVKSRMRAALRRLRISFHGGRP